VILHGNGARLLKERQARTVFISLSHTQSHATAVAILESV
jgi:phosphopantetheinyl transferase (holo-ACP synthase)